MRALNWSLPGLSSVVILLFGVVAIAAEDEKPAKTNYADHVRPVFREHCFICHGGGEARNDLTLDNYEKLMAGGVSGSPIEPGDPDSSYLWLLVSHEDEPSMPPNQGKLPEAKLALIKRWILDGALKDAGSKAIVKKGPAMDLSIPAGAGRPEGPVAMPDGLSREPVVVTPRPGAITAVASSPWAPVAAVAGQKQVVLYHSDTAELLGVLPFPEGVPHVLSFSRSGTLLLAGGGHAVRLGRVAVFDVKSGKRLFEVGDELDVVLGADINPSQTLIALGGPFKTVRVFATADGSLVREHDKHTDWVYAVRYSPDGILLATADRSGGLVVWEAESGLEYLNLTGHKGAITALSWRADSNVLASASEDGTVKLWEMQTGKELSNIRAHSEGVTSVDFTHDGRLVTCGRDRTVKVWDAAGGQLKSLGPTKDLPLEVTFTHDGQRVIAGDFAGEAQLWQVDDGKAVAALSPNPPATND